MLRTTLSTLVLLLTGTACSRAAAPERPSIILVSIDTLRADHVGLYGYSRPTTPFLDRWSQGGIVFERAFTTAAWTLVAHMTMLTGLFPDQHGVYKKNKALSPEIPLLAERLRAAGYRTHALFLDGWISARHGFDRGFDTFVKHADLAEADRHLRTLLPKLESEQPFFLFVHLFDVHCGDLSKDELPYQEPEPYQDQFVENRAPLPPGPFGKYWEQPSPLSPEQLAHLTALYDGGIRHVDERLENWFGELERRGLSRGALMIVTADHGEALGEHGRLNQHGDSWQSALHVPLIVRAPDGAGAGKRIETPVHLGDIVPTALAAAGVARDAHLPGTSLLGPIPPARVIAGIKLPEAFVLKWPEKIVLEHTLSGRNYRATDLEQDPDERSPRAGEPTRFDALRSEALGTMVFPQPLQAEMSDTDRAKLDALGYGGDAKDEVRKTPPK